MKEGQFADYIEGTIYFLLQVVTPSKGHPDLKLH